MKKIKISLMLQITILCVGLVLLFSLAMQFYANATSAKAIVETMGQTALNITHSVIDNVDGDKFEQLNSAEDMENEYYMELRLKLNNIKNTTGLKYLYTMKKNENGDYIYVVDGYELDSDEASLLGDVEVGISEHMEKCFEGIESYEFYDSDEWGALISGYVPIKNSSGKVVGMIAADFGAKHMVDRLTEANKKMLVFLIILVFISIVVAASFSYVIVLSIKKLQSKMQLVKQGDLTVHVMNDRADEVGSLSQAFQEMLDHMASIIHKIRSNSEEIVQNINSLNSSIDTSKQSTEEITHVINEIASGASDQVESVDIVANSMERVFQEIKSITDNITIVNSDSDQAITDMKDASDILKGSITQINLVNDTVENTAAIMKQLQDKFQEVLSFSSSVNAIANRTNLLALNASIEAASAGVHGKGFAVVAGEIKNLAKQSGEASNRINELIGAVQEEISSSSESIESGVVQARNGVDVIRKVEIYLDKLSNSNQKVDLRIKEIAKAIVNIEQDGRKVLEKTTSLADISREFSAGTQQTASESEEQLAIMELIRTDLAVVKDKMEQLSTMVNQFTINE